MIVNTHAGKRLTEPRRSHRVMPEAAIKYYQRLQYRVNNITYPPVAAIMRDDMVTGSGMRLYCLLSTKPPL